MYAECDFMINGINFNTTNKYNPSFGLNPRNLRAIETLYSSNDKGLRKEAIKSMDMADPDINPVLKEFTRILSSSESSNTDLNAVLDKIGEFKGGVQGLKDGFSNLMARWSALFMSVRAKAAAIMDKNGMIHPNIGGLSRTTCNPLFRDTALKNIEDANRYINLVTEKGKCPDKNFMVGLHKILTRDLSYIDSKGTAFPSSDYSGVIVGSSGDTIAKKLHLNDSETEKKLDEFFKWLERNYDKNETFTLAAQSYKKLLGIVPFYDANGRTIRGFIDALLLSKGYRFKQYPSNFAEVRGYKTENLAQLIKDNCEEAL